VIFVLTHDSVGLGEDGPTHQPIEHLASLRAIPNLDVYRPADAVETAECWAAALESDRPSVLALSRQNLRPVRTHAAAENLSARGAYILRPSQGPAKVNLLATGSEVEIALDVTDQLEADGIAAQVVSLVCWERFEAQDAAYRAEILGNSDVLPVSIEAGSTFGWERYTGRNGIRIGIDRFGASAKGEDLYAYFGLTAEAIAPKIMEALKR
jgi:transketolase